MCDERPFGRVLVEVLESHLAVDTVSEPDDSKNEGDGFDINGDVTMDYKAWDFEQDDNFTQVNVGPKTISAETCDKKGKVIKKSNLKLA